MRILLFHFKFQSIKLIDKQQKTTRCIPKLKHKNLAEKEKKILSWISSKLTIHKQTMPGFNDLELQDLDVSVFAAFNSEIRTKM